MKHAPSRGLKPWSLSRLAVVGLVLAAAPWCAGAGSLDVVPSCLDHPKLPGRAEAAELDLFIAIDQTTPLDDALKQSLSEQLRPLIKPGLGFTVFQFSAYTQGRYTDLLVSGRLDTRLSASQRDDINKQLLTRYDACANQQPALASRAIGQALKTALGGTSTDISKSDVLASLKDISARVRQSKAAQKVVLVVSDMLENSSVSSFYASQNVRKLDPEHELKLASAAGMLGDFGGARVFVMGAGLIEGGQGKKGVYRDPKTMQALAKFWSAWFQKSNAELREFGQPALLNPVH